MFGDSAGLVGKTGSRSRMVKVDSGVEDDGQDEVETRVENESVDVLAVQGRVPKKGKDGGKSLDKGKKCNHCENLMKNSKGRYFSDHKFVDCPNKKIIVRAVLDTEVNESDKDEGNKVVNSNKVLQHDVQNEDGRAEEVEKEEESSFYLTNKVRVLSNRNKEIKKIAEFYDRSKASWCTDTGQIRSERSPSFKADLKGMDFVVTIDEGAEVNVVSQELVKKAGIKVVGTSKETTSADGSGMEVIGRTEKELVFNGHFEGAKVLMNLGSVVVVKRLTAQLLLGEPGKMDNRVRTLPDEKKIEVRTKDGIYRTDYLN